MRLGDFFSRFFTEHGCHAFAANRGPGGTFPERLGRESMPPRKHAPAARHALGGAKEPGEGRESMAPGGRGLIGSAEKAYSGAKASGMLQLERFS
jgi:hypothetical protein